jgi:hypothetical protein
MTTITTSSISNSVALTDVQSAPETTDAAGQQDAQTQGSPAAAPADGTPVPRSPSLPLDSAIPANIAIQLKQGAANGANGANNDASDANNPSVIDNTRRVFSIAGLMAMPTWQIQGAGDPELAAAMTKLQGTRDAKTGDWKPCDPAQAQDALATVARIRGVGLEKITQDYQTTLSMIARREERTYKAGQKHIPFNELDTKNEHRVPLLSMSAAQGLPDNSAHMGSNDQLRFGKMVGDSLGDLDPVFGALLSPTGGITGPGNDRVTSRAAIVVAGSAEALANHSIAHDAGGYLRTYHGIGPGYHYVPNQPGLFPDTNPLGGHGAGLTLFSNIHLYGTPTAPRPTDGPMN